MEMQAAVRQERHSLREAQQPADHSKMLTTDRTEDHRKERVEIMIIEAVRRIIAPAITVLTRIMAILRAVTIVTGILTIAGALRDQLAGRTIDSESRQALRRLFRKHP